MAAQSPRYGVFIRALNVSSANRITMPALRKHVEDTGLEWISSYLATGNIIVANPEKPSSVKIITEKINEALSSAGLHTAQAIVWETQDLEKLVEEDHFVDKYPEAKWRHCVAFFAQTPPNVEAGCEYLKGEKQVEVIRTGERFVIFAAPRERKGFSVNIECAFHVSATTRWWNVLRKFVASRVVDSHGDTDKESSRKVDSSRK